MFLLTGGSGDLGAEIAKYLIQDNEIITSLTRKDWDMGVPNNIENLPEIKHPVKYIFHFADVSRKSMPDSAEMLQLNINIIDNAMELWNRYPDAIFVSFTSLLMYNSSISGSISIASDLNIDVTNSNYYYARSKLYLRDAVKFNTSKKRGVILLLGNIYGMISNHKLSNFISDLIKKMMNQSDDYNSILIQSDGREKRTFMHVYDLYRTIKLVIDDEFVDYKEIEVNGRSYTVRHAVSIASELLKNDKPIIYNMDRKSNDRIISPLHGLHNLFPQEFLTHLTLTQGLTKFIKELETNELCTAS